MEEHFFTVQPEKINQGQFTLSKSESNHLIKSLRGNPGDIIWLLNGNGCAFEGLIESVQGNTVTGLIKRSIPDYGEASFAIHLVIGLIKGSRMDMVLEKATELGVKSIQPILFDRCVKNKLNFDRAKRIVQSAAKQAGRSYFPKIYPLSDLDQWLINHAEESNILFHIKGTNSLDQIVKTKKELFNIIVGPEGDFSDRELIKLKAPNILNVNLGSRRLRSETAVVAALANLNQLLGK